MSLTYSFEQVIYNQTIIKQVIKFYFISIMIKSTLKLCYQVLWAALAPNE